MKARYTGPSDGHLRPNTTYDITIHRTWLLRRIKVYPYSLRPLPHVKAYWNWQAFRKEWEPIINTKSKERMR